MEPADVPDGPIMVDTDVFSFVHYGKGRHVEFTDLISGHRRLLSFAAVGELIGGAIKGGWGERRRVEQQRFFRTYTVVPTNRHVVDQYAALHAHLHTNLRGGGVNDMWTAACALVLDVPVATNNLTDFGLIQEVAPRLRLVHPDLPATGTVRVR